MSTTTMHFGPEWMRTKHHTPTRTQGPPPSPPPTSASFNNTYSSLVSATPPATSESADEVHPFRYSKEDLLRIYQEGGGKGGLGLEVERWEGVVREIGVEPTTLREMTEAEKKLFSGPLNSELRRRPSQSTDFLSPLTTTNLDRSRISHGSNSAGSPLRDRFASIKRRDSAAGVSDPVVSIPRKPSLSTLQQATGMSPRDSSPRTRVGYSTTNFDGVLNNGDPWTPRRRAPDNVSKPGNGAPREGQDANGVFKQDGIREEKEDDATKQAHGSGEEGSPYTSSHSLQSDDHQAFDGVVGLDGKAVANPVPTHNLGGTNMFTGNRPDIIPNLGAIDLAAVEWSYKDPTGQIQGPFRADLMQKWYNDGYFSADLPMRRTKYDTNWITVGDLVAQAPPNGNIFLTPLPSAMGPPGLSRGSPMRPFMGQDPVYNEPYQPSPIRSLRTSALESYIGGGSIPSESPSSSFGPSHFNNGSPEPSMFNHHTPDPTNPRLSGLVDSPMMNRRLPNHEYTPNMPSQLYGGYTRPQDQFNPYGFNNNVHNTHEQWMVQPNAFGTPGYHQPRDVPQQIGFENVPHAQALYAQDNQSHTGSPAPRAAIYGGYGYAPSPMEAQLQQTDFSSGHVANPQQSQVPVDVQDAPVNEQVHAVESEPITSPWNTAVTEASIVQPAAQAETLSPQPAPAPAQSPWGNVQPAVPVSEEAPTASMAQLAIDEAWPTPVAASQEESRPAPKPQAEVVQVAQEESSSPSPIESTEAVVSEAPAPATPTIVERSGSSETVPPPKLAWAKEDDNKKKKGVTPSISLREIQEAEAKKAEARKVAEKEKERLARVSVVAADTKEDVQPFIASWGLPTSQTGSRSTPMSASASASSPVPTTPQPTTPVWTTPAKPLTAKKTMKEIQEEEERRKKLAAKEAPIIATPVKRYADTTSKTPVASSPAVATVSNVWTTVGPNGKSGATPPVPRPASTTIPATSSVMPVTRPAPAPAPVRTAAIIAKPKSALVPSDDSADMPSHEFLKWLGDSLKGLNSSVNVEEIISMLLSFPLDPDSLTTEIISDTIYSNSTTLDGRRFAAEFVAKRKADAVARKSAKATSKPISIAEVVKATPKPAQNEWGGFKVVNKKKKGGRA